MKPFLSYLLFSTLLFTCTITPIASYTQVKSFGNIVLTTNETLYFDLHEYFAGSISTFSVDSPYTVTPKSQERSPQSSINVSNILAVDIPKGLFDNWVHDQYWIFLDSNNTLQYFSQTGDPNNPTLTYAKSITFLTATYTCQSLLRIDIDLIAVGCLELFSPSLNKTHIYFVQISTGELQGEFVLKYGNNVYLEKFPNDIRYVIVYSKTDISCDASGQVVTLDITDPTNPTQMNNTFRASTFNVPNFCLQDFGILNGIFYFATSDGSIFLAENPLNDPPGPLNRFQINDVILTMSVVSGAYYGQPTTTIVAASTNYVYYYDWTDTTIDGVPVNKYSLSPIGTSVQSVNYVQISQDFVSAIVTTSSGGCSMAVYYLDQSLPEDIYYMNNCPINSGLIDSSRPANTFFFASNNAQTTSVSMFQISRSILQISSSSPINTTSYLTVNSDRIPLQIFAIDVADSKVYATSTQPASYGLVVPGQASFDMTGVLNGPFLSYTSNNSDYNILPPFESTSLTTDSSVAAIQYSTFYNSEETNTIYWFSFTNNTSDDTESSTFLIDQQACTSSAATYSCKSLQPYHLDTTVTDMTANGQFFFYTGYNETDSTDTIDLSDDIPSNLITILDYQMNYQGYLLPVNDSDSCTQLLASPWASTPFLYCLGNSSLFVYRVDNLTAAQSTGASLELSIFKHGLQNVSIQLNYNFPSILFLQAGNAIYLLETFALMEGGSPILSTILVQSFDQGFSFAVAGQSLIVYIPYSETVIEYDISHPYNPVQLKMLLTIGFSAEQILGDSTYADNVYLFGFNAQSSQPVALIYRPRMTANSNYLAAIGLPLTLFDPSKVQTYPRYPVISLGSTELFVMPDGQNFGWSVKSRVQVDFSATNVDDSEASDYEQDVQVSITGTHPVNPIASAIASVTFDLIVTNEKIRAQQTLCYTPSLIKNTPGPNTISLDPRNYFNGSISSYSIAPSTDSEASMIQLVQQVSGGQSLAFTPSTTLIDTLMILNQTFVGQSQNMLYFLKNGTQSSMELGNSSFTCLELTYNSYIQEMLTMCSLENDEYYFSIIKPADGTFVQYPLIATSTTGKKITNVQKVVFTAQAIYILENIGKFGSFIHVFSFTAPYTIQYLDSISSGDLNTDFLTIADLTINYRGTSSQYRLFMIDSAGNGLRTLDVTFTSKSISFSNANLIPLQGPSNVIWNGIMSVFEVGDTAIPIGLIVTSSNYKSYYIQYSQSSGVTIERNFVPSAGTNIVRPCYADSDTFIMSAYGTDGQKYALVYTISNITSTPNGQNFPIFSQTYTSNAVGTCSFSFDNSDATEPTFYASNAPNLTNYIVSSNISLIFNGSLSSEYIKISATSAVSQDSFNFYLVPPPQPPNSNMLFWYLIIGGVALLITVVLLCYCFIKCKKKRDRVKDTESYYENVKDSEAGRA